MGAGRPVVGRFLLVEELACGPTSTVWRAWDLRRRRWVAAKVLRRASDGLLLRFVREASVRVRHPHVLTPAQWVADGDVVAVVTELMGGGSLHLLVAEYGALPPDLVGVLLEQVLSGLAAVHAAGWVHRDLKPANLLLAATGTAWPRVLLADFGVAVPLAGPRLTVDPSVVGTAGYVAPEVLGGAAPDPRQDLYAVGVLGCELASGGRPSVPATSGVAVGGRYAGVLRTLTDPDPALRPASAEEALALLRAVGVPDSPTWRSPVFVDRLGPGPAVRRRDRRPSLDWLRVATLACFGAALALSSAALALLVAG